MILAFFVVHKVTKWSEKIKNIDELDKKIDASITALDSKFDKRSDKLDTKIDGIKESILEIKAFITVFKESNNQFVQSKSPITLTEIGETVVKDLDLISILTKYWNKLENVLLGNLENKSNLYVIQQESFSLGSKLTELLDENEIENIKTYAFNQGQNLANYDLMIGVCIRDIYFKKHNINIIDIEKFDPNQIKNEK